MRELLDHLRADQLTFTLFNYTGSAALRERIGTLLAVQNAVVVEDTTASGEPTDFGVLHDGGRVLEMATVGELRDRCDVRTAIDGTRPPQVFEELDGETTTARSKSRREMVRISREFEQRAWREREGRLVSGFQELSRLSVSPRTRHVYDRLAGTGVDVTVVGYPDVDLPDPPFSVVEDAAGDLRDYWFLFYDGGGADDRKATLVAEETEPGSFTGFWTVDPETVDDLFDLVREAYPDLV